MFNSAFPKRYERKLSPSERFWLSADNPDRPFAIQAVLEGEGEFDLDCWQNAATRASAANPGSRLVLRGHLGWSHWVDSEVPFKVHLLDGGEWNGTDPDNAPFLTRPLPARSGPTCEVLLLTGIPKRVILRAHHAVMDGLGGLCLINDLFRELRGEKSLGSRGVQTDLDIAHQIGSSTKKKVTYDAYPPLSPIKSAEHIPGTTWRRITIPSRCSKPLSRIVLEVAQSANGVRVDTQALKADKHSDPGTSGVVRLDIPVNMRRHCREMPASTANLTGVVVVEADETATLTGILDTIRNETDGNHEGDHVASLAHLRWIPLRLIKYAWLRIVRRAHVNHHYVNSGVISNLGRWPIEHFHGGGFRATSGFAVPPGGEGVPLFIVFNIVGRQTEIVAVTPNCVATGEQLQFFLGKIRDALVKNSKKRA